MMDTHDERVVFQRGHKVNDQLKAQNSEFDQPTESFFTEMIEQYQQTMLRIAQRYVSSMESAEDVVQETWLAALRGWHKFEGRSSFKTWLFTILVNRSYTESKRERRTISLESLIEDNHEDGLDSFVMHSCKYEVSPMHGILVASGRAELPEEQTIYNELCQWIDQAIMSLPDNLRQVIVLRDLEGWTAEETCTLLELSHVNQRVLLHRARSKVRQILEVLLNN